MVPTTTATPAAKPAHCSVSRKPTSLRSECPNRRPTGCASDPQPFRAGDLGNGRPKPPGECAGSRTPPYGLTSVARAGDAARRCKGDSSQHTCQQAGGTFTAGGSANNPNPNADRCTVTTSSVTFAPSGAPTVTRDTRNVGDPVTATQTVPTGEPTVTSRTVDDGEATSVTQTVPAGAPVVTSEDRNVGDPTATTVTVPAGAPTLATETVLGQPTSVTAPGPVRNCRQVNDARARRPVTRCDTTEITTTTTPTTLVTTTTTPQMDVTTSTQQTEVVTTTTTPRKIVTTTTQPRQTIVTSTQATTVVTTSTQQTETVVTTTQPTQGTRTTTTTRFRFVAGTNVFAPNPEVTTTTAPAGPGEPIVTQTTVPGTPVVTVAEQAGAPVVTVTTTPAAPTVTVAEQQTAPLVTQVVTPGAPVVTVTQERVADLVVITETPGAPIVTAVTRTTGTCVQNPGSGNGPRACPRP